MLLRRRIQMHHDFHATACTRDAGAARIIDAAKIDEHVEVHRRIVAKKIRDRLPALGRDARGVIAEVGVRLEDRVAEFFFQHDENGRAHDLPPLLFGLPSSCVLLPPSSSQASSIASSSLLGGGSELCLLY